MAGSHPYPITDFDQRDMRTWRLHHWLMIIPCVAAYYFIASHNWLAQYHMDILRQQLHLPADVPFAEFKSWSRNIRRPTIEGIVRFSPEQFRAYTGFLDNTDVWSPVPLAYDGTKIHGSYTPDALRWTGLPLPYRAGRRELKWGHLSEDRVRQIRDGRVLCVAYSVLRGEPRADGERDVAYRAAGCAEVEQPYAADFYMMAVLDHDTRTLHMVLM